MNKFCQKLGGVELCLRDQAQFFAEFSKNHSLVKDFWF